MLQQVWGWSEPLEVVAELVCQALDREERDASLLSLMEELEASGVTDPVEYLADLVQRERTRGGQPEALVAYQHLPYSRLVGIQTPAANTARLLTRQQTMREALSLLGEDEERSELVE